MNRGVAMQQLKFLSVMLVALLSVSCASINKQMNDAADITVETKLDPKANMDGYKSYKWLAVGAMLRDPENQWQPPGFAAGDYIKMKIDKELKAKEFVLNQKGEADLGVVFTLGVNMDAHKLKVNPETDQEEMLKVAQGALVVAMIDMRTGFVVWVGKATGENKIKETGVDDERTRKRLQYVITTMLEDIK